MRPLADNKQTRMKKLLFTFFFLLLTGVLTACNLSLAADVTPPPGYQPPPEAQASVEATASLVYPLVAPDPPQGKKIYAEKCAPCHGATGLGDGSQASDLPNPATPFASGEAARDASPADWFGQVTNGNLERFMPPFQSLSISDRWNVVAYVYSLGITPVVQELGEQLYLQECTTCHGDRGQGDGPQAASLNVTPVKFTDQFFMAQKTNRDFFNVISNGFGSLMPAFADRFSENERWALAEHIRSLSFSASSNQASETQTSETDLAGQDLVQSTAPVEESERSELSPGLAMGIVAGKLLNIIEGNLSEGFPVTLYGFDHMNIVLTQSTSALPDGSFAFDPVEMPEGRIFLATVDYKGVTYSSEPVTAGPDQSEIDLSIEVFETSTNTSSLYVDRLHMFFEFLGPETIRVVELYIVSNPTRETVVAPEGEQTVLSFSLPKDAENLEIQDGRLGERFIQTENGFGDTRPVPPGMGDYQVLFSYEMPYIKRLEFEKKVQLATNAVIILAPENGLEIKGETLQDAGKRDVQGSLYRMYNGGAIAAGGDLKLSISGKMVGSDTQSTSNILIGLGAFGIVLVFAGMWLYKRYSSSAKDVHKEPVASDEIIPENADAIMDAILTLDDLFQENEIPEEAYLQRRSQLKAILKRVLEHDQP